MKFADLFLRQMLADSQLRYVVPSAFAIGRDLFQTYAPSDMFKECAHEFSLSQDFDFSDDILNFTTEGRWLCLMSDSYKSRSLDGRLKIHFHAVIRFQSEGDRALFRLMLP